MGAWGISSFDNDTALDWVYELEGAEDTSILQKTLSQVKEEEDYPDAWICSEAIAAAEVVAALKGNPAENLPEEVEAWVKGKGQPDPALVSLAKEVLNLIIEDSELKELWEETEDFQTWKKDVEGIIERLR